ncbi:MAG: SOS response-associated peptidase [Anaerolineales bacterium]|jgi:putative SOS response-associated peptidase YedK|nr:SOS response-associated peptidase [Anaerolineales bacterium]
MCGRFTLTLDPGELKEAFPDIQFPSDFSPRYNIAPSQPVAVISNAAPSQVSFYTWGLIPSWAKDPAIGSRMINARAETLAEKPSFRTPLRRRRCLILADGFYEWQEIPGSKAKQPIFIHLKDRRPFAFAGLWDLWHAPDASLIYSCTIITTQPNALMEPIHNRMPAILPASSYAAWLEPGERQPAELSRLLAPYPAEDMAAYPVSRLVNSPAVDEPACIAPLKA